MSYNKRHKVKLPSLVSSRDVAMWGRRRRQIRKLSVQQLNPTKRLFGSEKMSTTGGRMLKLYTT
jgi:hypothetical protein